MADRIETSIALPKSVEVHSTEEDDPALWQLLQTVAALDGLSVTWTSPEPPFMGHFDGLATHQPSRFVNTSMSGRT
jgi:hypothetical protein